MKTSYWILLAIFIFQWSCREDIISPDALRDISGTVLNESNLPVEGVKVSTDPGTNVTFTKADGTFLLEAIAAGDYTLKFEKNEYITGLEKINLSDNFDSKLTIVLKLKPLTDFAPDLPSQPMPADKSQVYPSGLVLSWICKDANGDSLSFEVLMNMGVGGAMIPVTSALNARTFTPTGLQFNTTYLWQVIASDPSGKTTYGPVWTFSTIPFPNHEILYVSRKNGRWQIFSCEADGKNPLALTNADFNAWKPEYSPNGNRIAFFSDEEGPDWHLYVMNLDGTGKQRVSPLAAPATGLNSRTIDFCWSPDGEYLLYTASNTLRLQPVFSNGKAAQEVKIPPGAYFASVDWSNQSIIARSTDPDGFGNKFWSFNFSGAVFSSPQLIVEIPQGQVDGPVFSFNADALIYTHDVSPAPKTIFQGFPENSRLFLIPDILNPGTPKDISKAKIQGTSDLQPRFTPSGSKIIFLNYDLDKKIFQVMIQDKEEVNSTYNRLVWIPNAEMPEWK